MICQKCNTELADNAKFCLECGTKVETSVKCSCGAEYKIGTKFCSKCGNALGEGSGSPKASETNPSTEPTDAKGYFERAKDLLEYATISDLTRGMSWEDKEKFFKDREEKYDAAIEDLTKAMSLRDKENADDYHWRGRAYFFRKNNNNVYLTEVLSLKNDETTLGNKKETYVLALKDFTKAIKLRGGKNADDYFWLGKVHYYEGNYDIAIKEIVKAMSLRNKEKEDAWDYYFRGRAYYGKENYDAAIEDFTKAISLRDKEDAWDYYWRGGAYWNKANRTNTPFSSAAPLYDPALKDFTKAISLRDEEDNGIAWDYLWLGMTYCRQAKYDTAINVLTKAISLRNKAVDYYWRGCVYYLKGNKEAALKDYTKVLEIDQNFTYADYVCQKIKECTPTDWGGIAKKGMGLLAGVAAAVGTAAQIKGSLDSFKGKEE